MWINSIILENSYKTLRTYRTAIKVDKADKFNYSIDTRQGNVLAWANFKAVGGVKFPEMNKSFLAVEKHRERYTRHEDRVCTTDSEGNESCHTEISYDWDHYGEEKLESPQVDIYGRNYPTSNFGFTLRSTKAYDVVPGADDYWYVDGKPSWFWGASEGDTRYYYKVVDLNVSGSILVNTRNGTLENLGGGKIGVSDQSIEQRIEEQKNKASLAKWAFIIVWTILTLGISGGIAYAIYENYFYY